MLTEAEQEALRALDQAFGAVDHGLGSIAVPACAPTRTNEVRTLLRKGVANWTRSDIDWLFFKASTTVGDEDTVKFALPRLGRCLMQDANFGSTSASIIPSKLDYANFGAWPEPERRAALDALSVLSDRWATDKYYNPDSQQLRDFISRHRPN